MPPVGVFAGLAGDVAFGKTGDADGKTVARADEFHKLGRKFKTAGRRLEFSAAGRVAAERENVLAAERADFFQQRAALLARVVDAGQVRKGGQTVLALDAVHDVQRFVARAAAGAISHRAIIRFGGEQRGDLFFQQGAVAVVRLRRKKFKRNDRLSGRQLLGVDVADETHVQLTGLILIETTSDAK